MNHTDVIWDFDGTLFDTYPAMAAAFRMALNECGIDEDDAHIMGHMKISMVHTRAHYIALGDALFERYEALRPEVEAALAHPFAGIAEICRAICTAGGRNFIFTHRGASIFPLLRRFDMERDFTDIVTSEQGFARKPSPDGLNHLIERHGIARANALMIGDRALDVLSGKNANIAACYYGDDVCEAADYCISSWSQLPELLGLSGFCSAC